MAARNEVPVQPPEDGYLRCPLCGWHDRKLRRVGSVVTPEQRIEIHMWARHDAPLPDWAP